MAEGSPITIASGGGDAGADDGYRGNQPKTTRELSEWLEEEAAEPILNPGLPIIDPHHHVFGAPGDRLVYRLPDLRRDLDTGHRVIGTVYVEAYEANWRKDGPEEMRPVGEVEWIARASERPAWANGEECQVAAGIVSHVDLDRGETAGAVLQAQVDAGRGRLRGVRQRTAVIGGAAGRYTWSARHPRLLADAGFRRGFALLDGFGLSFDAWVHHTQLSEVIDLADAFPRTTIVLNHVGGPIGVAEFRQRRAEVLQAWRGALGALASRPNVAVKVGGMGMPLLGFDFNLRMGPPGSAELASAWRSYVEACVDAFGTARCMFESNFPVDKQSCSYRSLWNGFKLITQGWSTDERNDLFYRTACRTYRLPELEQQGNELMAAVGR